MKQRKLLAMLMVFVLIFSISGCGKEKEKASESEAQTPFEFYREVSENMKQIQDSEMKGTVSVNMPNSEKKTIFSTDYEVKLRRNSDSDMDMALKLNQEGSETAAYYTGGYLYTDSGDSKIKTKVDAKDALKMTGNLDFSQITQEMMKDARLSREGTDTVLHYSLSSDRAEKLLNASMGTLGSAEAGASLSMLSDLVTFGDMEVKITADKDKMIKSSEMTVPMEVSAGIIGIGGDASLSGSGDGGKTIKMTCQFTVKWTGINEGAAIDFPDFSEYQEATV